MEKTLCLAALILVLAPRLQAQQAGTVRWRIPIGNPASTSWSSSSSPALARDGTLYIANGFLNDVSMTAARSLYSITPAGRTNWVFTVGRDIPSSPAVGPDGNIYAGSLDGNLYCINPAGGTNWLFPTGGRIYSSPAIAADGTLYVSAISNQFNKIYSVHPDGTSNWVFDLGPVHFTTPGSAQFSSPAIGPDGSIYLGSMDTNLYAINPNGTMSWTYRLGNVTYGSPSIGADGTVYIGSDDQKLHAIAPGGYQRWEFSTSAQIESSPVIAADGTLYVPSLDRRTYVLTPAGIPVRNVPGFSDSPALADNGTFYLAPGSVGIFQAFDQAGSNRWTLNLNVDSLIFSSPVIGADGTIYVAAGPFLVAIYGDSPPQPAHWGMFRRESTHAARAIQCALTQPALLPDGSFGLTLGSETGLAYRVQASIDLATWTDLVSVIPTNFTTPFIDLEATNFPSRFYRLGVP